MSTLPESIEVRCPRCGEAFGEWDRPLADPASSSVCPSCGHRLGADESLFRDGAWEPALDDLDATDR